MFIVFINSHRLSQHKFLKTIHRYYCVDLDRKDDIEVSDRKIMKKYSNFAQKQINNIKTNKIIIFRIQYSIHTNISRFFLRQSIFNVKWFIDLPSTIQWNCIIARCIWMNEWQTVQVAFENYYLQQINNNKKVQVYFLFPFSCFGEYHRKSRHAQLTKPE